MVTGNECEGYARECVRLAQRVRHPENREQLLQMAREWRAESLHEGQVTEPKSALAG